MADESKQAQTVVTSENLDEFMAKRIGMSAPEKPVVADDTRVQVDEENKVEETPVEALKADEEDQEEEHKEKVKNSYIKLREQRNQAREEANRVKAEKDALQARITELEGKKDTAEPAKPAGKPEPNEFTDAFAYAEALSEWKVTEALNKRDQVTRQAQLESERAKVAEGWKEKVNETIKEITDWADIVGSSDVAVSDQVRDAIIESDIGPKILYHLAENPDLAEKINNMTVQSAIKEIGKIEAKLDTKQEVEKEVEVSKAPKPISPLKGKTSAAELITSDGEFQGNYQAWKAARKAGKIK